MDSDSRRALWTVSWLLFTGAWAFAAVLLLATTDILICGGDGGEPYAAPASPRGRYCAGFAQVGGRYRGFALIAFAAAVLLVAGLAAIRHQRLKRLLITAGVAIALLAAQFAVSVSLSPTCDPDEPANPGCAHY